MELLSFLAELNVSPSVFYNKQTQHHIKTAVHRERGYKSKTPELDACTHKHKQPTFLSMAPGSLSHGGD